MGIFNFYPLCGPSVFLDVLCSGCQIFGNTAFQILGTSIFINCNFWPPTTTFSVRSGFNEKKKLGKIREMPNYLLYFQLWAILLYLWRIRMDIRPTKIVFFFEVGILYKVYKIFFAQFFRGLCCAFRFGLLSKLFVFLFSNINSLCPTELYLNWHKNSNWNDVVYIF